MTDAPDPVSLIPAAHLPGAVQTVTQNGKNDPNMLQMLRSMQAQINAMMKGQQLTIDQPDVVVVNPTGRIVEITGEMAEEYLAKPGFRKANETEEANYRKAMLRQTPQYLRRLEKKRLQDEAALLDSLEEPDNPSGPSDLLRTEVTDAQKTGAPEPATELPETGIPNVLSDSADSADADGNTTVPKRRATRQTNE